MQSCLETIKIYAEGRKGFVLIIQKFSPSPAEA